MARSISSLRERFSGRRSAAGEAATVAVSRVAILNVALRVFQDGKTEVIEGFISKKGRPFNASLNFEPEGKRTIRWEFPPREPKKKTAKKKAAKASS